MLVSNGIGEEDEHSRSIPRLQQTSWTLQANEGKLARLTGEPVGVVAQS